MTAAGEQFEAIPRDRFLLGLRQDTPSHSDHGIACQNEIFVGSYGFGFLPRHTFRIIARQFGPAWRFVDIGGSDSVRDNAQTAEQFAATRAGGSEDEFACSASRHSDDVLALQRERVLNLAALPTLFILRRPKP